MQEPLSKGRKPMNTIAAGLLKSPQKDDQLKGLQILLREQDFDQLPLMLKLVAFPDPDISGLAMQAALHMSKAVVKERCRPVQKPVLQAAVGLLKTHGAEFTRNLFSLLDDINTDTVITGMIAVKHFIAPDKAEEFLRRYGKIPDNKIRATLVKHIGGIAVQRSPEVITRFLDDPDPRVRANTIEVMEQVGNKYYQRILSRFRTDAIPRIRANAVKTAFSMGDRTYLKSLEEMLQLFDKPAMRISAIWVIGEIGRVGTDCLGLLKAVAQEKNEEIRAQLRIVLDKVGLVPELEYLRGFLKEDVKERIKKSIIQNKGLKIEPIRKPRYLTLVLWGSLTVDTMLSLRFALQDLEAENTTRLVLDFTRIEYVDSSGAALLTNFSKRLEQKSGFFLIFGCNERIRELFQVTGLDYVLKIFNNEQDIENFLP